MQARNAPRSLEQVNEALGSLLTKVKVGLATFESTVGPVLMVAEGAIVSTVQVTVTVAEPLPATS